MSRPLVKSAEQKCTFLISQPKHMLRVLKKASQFLSVCFVALRHKSTAMVMAGRSVHLNTVFSWASLNKQLTTILLERLSIREENDERKYFIINLHESMGPGRDRTRYPWICSQTHICCQTHY